MNTPFIDKIIVVVLFLWQKAWKEIKNNKTLHNDNNNVI